MRAPLDRIAVFGGGQVALLAATALARTLPRATVTLVATPVSEAALADIAHTSLPSLARLHRRIGMDEAGMLRRAAGTHRLATRYRGWRTDGADWMLGYGAVPDPALGFVAQWQGVASTRHATDAAATPSAALAQAERFAAAADDPASALADLDHALRFDPDGHARRLSSLADHLHIERLTGAPAALDADGDASVCRLADGRAIAADLIVDCTGPEALVTALRGEPARIDWSDELPVTSVLVTDGPPQVSTLDEVAALENGYRITSPGRDRTRRLHCRSGSGDGVAISPRRLAQAWTGAVVAIGDAAAQFEPLGWCNLHLATCQIELLLELLPARAVEPLERKEYNRRAALMADRVRDFVALHHAAPSRPTMPRRSGTLRRTIDTFVRRGHLPFFEEESVPRDLWWQVLTGAGFAVGPNARVLSLTPDVRTGLARRHEARVAEAVAAAAPYPAWLSRELAR